MKHYVPIAIHLSFVVVHVCVNSLLKNASKLNMKLVFFFTVDSSEWRFYYRVDEYEVCAVCYGLITSYLVLEKNHAARKTTQFIGKVLFSHKSQERRD